MEDKTHPKCSFPSSQPLRHVLPSRGNQVYRQTVGQPLPSEALPTGVSRKYTLVPIRVAEQHDFFTFLEQQSSRMLEQLGWSSFYASVAYETDKNEIDPMEKLLDILCKSTALHS